MMWQSSCGLKECSYLRLTSAFASLRPGGRRLRAQCGDGQDGSKSRNPIPTRSGANDEVVTWLASHRRVRIGLAALLNAAPNAGFA
jgi:hypothetical protein